jgi:hypothetical protein
MEPDLACSIAMVCHYGQRDRFGGLTVEHLARVAAAVPPEAQATAWLHDALESSAADPIDLAQQGLSDVELAALELLTRSPSELYELYALRIAHAGGDEGRLARVVKLADLDDHLANRPIPAGAPPYAWARRHISSSQYLRHELAA